MLKQYYDECELFDSQLRGLDEKMRNDRKCKMMYRMWGRWLSTGGRWQSPTSGLTGTIIPA